MPDTLFDKGKNPRAKPRVMMHVVDAGPGCEIEGGPHAVVLECGWCGHNTGWITVQTITEGKRGKPCPVCNKLEGDHA